MRDKVKRHLELCQMLNAMYEAKNRDYGDSFHATYAEEGLAMPRIRMSDKLNRFKTLTKQNPEVTSESIVDTLMDLANYALMTVMEIEESNVQL